MNTSKFLRVTLSALVGVMALAACNVNLKDKNGVPIGATRIQIVANTGAMPWLEQAAEKLNDGRVKSANKPVYADLISMEAGQAVNEFTRSTATMWIPDDEAWPDVLASRGNTAFKGNCVSTATSPLVIAMWKDIADALGYPARSLGWLDISSLTADPQSWGYYTGGQFGKTLRIAHANPGLSASGANTLMAVAQAAKSSTAPVSASDVASPIVKASIGAFEGGVAVFASSTAALAQAMSSRDAKYLGAAVMYESTIVQMGKEDIVPVYPYEGTFVATHPACINSGASAEEQAAAKVWRDALLGADMQKLALQNGLRPVNGAVKLGAPLSADAGFDTAQPKIVFGASNAAALLAAQDVWKAARKPVNLVMVLDVSGSMAGDKINGMRDAAAQFIQQMGNDDVISLISFSTAARTIMENQKMGAARNTAISAVRGLNANGNTALFDAVAQGATLIAKYNSPSRTNIMIVLTDGLDTASKRKFDAALIKDATANNTSLYTIAYGGDANTEQLDSLAKQSNGTSYIGSEANISQIYQDMSAAFGGSVGIGR